MCDVREVAWSKAEELLADRSLSAPIEQTEAWAAFQATIEGRTPWGLVALSDGAEPVALVSLIDYQTHGYHYLRAPHGPFWFDDPTDEQEQAALEALRAYVRKKDRKQLFMRLAVDHDLGICSPVLSGVPYDATVVIDVTGGDEAILTRMKPRGRRDVRKSLREAPITCADETEEALRSFDEYYPVMVETAQRDGFSPAPQEDYERMMHILGAEHCRLFVGRLADEQTVCTWSLCTVSGTRAVRYYAASLTGTMRNHVSDRLCYFECCELGKRGCAEYDLMGIGSEFSPSLMGLNEFKTKFCKEVRRVAPDRDLPIKKLEYGALQTAKRGRQALRDLRTKKA